MSLTIVHVADFHTIPIALYMTDLMNGNLFIADSTQLILCEMGSPFR